jgi:hypothetical protein
MTREPLALRMLIVAILQYLFLMLNWGELDTDAAEGFVTVIIIGIGVWRARKKVTPVDDPRGLYGSLTRGRKDYGSH